MARKPKLVRHLLSRDGRYFARVAVPESLRPIVGKRELLEPLGADRALAIVKLHGAVDRFHKILGDAKRGVKPALPPISISHAVHDHYTAALDRDAARDLGSVRGRPHVAFYDPSQGADIYLRWLRKVALGHVTDDERAEGMIEATIGRAIDAACAGKERPAIGSKPYLDLAQALAQAQIEAIERIKERDRGDWTGEPAYRLLKEPPIEPSADKAPVSIDGLFETYLAMLARSGKGTEAGKRWRSCFRSLIDFLGHDDARKVAKADLQRWVEHLRLNKAEKTIKDVYLGSIKAVFTYAAEQDLIDANPAQYVRIRMGRREQGREKGFSDAEASAILKASRAYQPKPSDNPQTRESAHLVQAKRWAPLLCAQTGARIAEITQLRKEDVSERDGIHFVRLTPDAGSIKTGHFRDVPLHPQIIAEGFLDFVAGSPSGPLFYQERADRKGKTHPSKTVSGRLSQWLRALAIFAESVDPSHGWRHRFKTIGREAGIDGRVLDAIQGHAARTAGDSYGDVTLRTKAAQIERLPSIFFSSR